MRVGFSGRQALATPQITDVGSDLDVELQGRVEHLVAGMLLVYRAYDTYDAWA